ncbi:sialate O-acetylesterase [Haloferula sp. A504]|uniref:sialate O-acetylesterase n=1 Tax=Haloferula sp. A504 TaxID=3373601 RepID=UPI0031BE9BB9|nr:hypothetical protein [Verrucomicrobiaceae bacterium E54]
MMVTKPHATTAILVAALGLLLASPARAAHLKVFLLAGQSNMVGQASASGLPAELQAPQTDVLFYDRTGTTTPVLGSLQPRINGFGPEITFGRDLAATLPSENFALIKYAQGGTTLYSSWDPTREANYAVFRQTVTDGLAALTAAGHTYEIVGMLWTQGESDGMDDRTAAQYEADLVEFVGDVRSRYGADLPFFLSRLSVDQTRLTPTQLSGIRTAQENFAASDAHSYLIDTDGFEVSGGDNLHFTAQGTMDLGSAFADAYLALHGQQAGISPVKIFILAGQSNMLGHGEVSPVTTPGTLEFTVENDPDGDYQFLVDGSGNWRIRDDVWIRDQDTSAGGLTVGFASAPDCVGPELGFGHLLGDVREEQILIVKAAWGGKSLANDFRPPSSGQDPVPLADGDAGFYYQEILRLVSEATNNLSTYFPDYDGGGYEIIGFGWHQGYNDRISETSSAEYEVNMANFIRDMRTDLGVPDLPFVIATTGMGGEPDYSVVEMAQMAMADGATYPDFDGSVAVIDTRAGYEDLEFWQPVDLSPENQSFHWNRNAKTYTNIGLAMGDAMSLLVPGRCPFRLRAEGAPAGGVSLSWKNGTELPSNVRVLRDGVEIAAAAPVGSETFLDASALPGVRNYELQFAMPGAPCDPLTLSFNGGITDLDVERNPGSFVLTWTNHMAYDGITVSRDGTVLAASLPGTATTFTDNSPPTSGLVTYSVVPTTGDAVPATFQIDLDLRGQMGLLDLGLNSGINPATFDPWQEGDAYRLAFVTSATTDAISTDISTYDAFVQGLAVAAGLGDVKWKVIGSTATVDARDHIDTEGVAVFLVDGATRISSNSDSIWSGLQAPIDIDELGTTGITGKAFTGTEENGLAVTNGRTLGGSGEDPPRVRTGEIGDASKWTKSFNAEASSSLRVFAISDPLVVVDGSDTTAPTLVSISDDLGGGPVFANDPVTYMVTFSEAMNTFTVGLDDFDNASGTPVTIDSVSTTPDPAVFEVVATALTTGTLQLRIAPTASLKDVAGNLLDAGAAPPDDTIITVTSDTIAPSLLSFVDNVSGGPVFPGDPVNYTVTFDDAMNAATIGTDDFENGSTAPVTIQSVSATADPAVFELVVLPTGPGLLQVQVAAGATLEDLGGNALDTGSAIPDDTVITVQPLPDLVGELGILDVTANGGINPATGAAWAAGDTYRLAFVTSATSDAISTDISTYNSFVQGLADAAGLGDATWKAIGSTPSVDARDNTGTHPGVDGGVAVFLLDGATMIAASNAALWDGNLDAPLDRDELGNTGITGKTFTGTETNGAVASAQPLGGAPDTLKVRTGSISDPAKWTKDFNSTATNSLRFFALSDPLTVVSTAVGSDYDNWAATYAPADLGTPGDDFDGDGLSNDEERIWGLDPTRGSSVSPITTGLDATAGTLSYTRRKPSLSGASFTYEWSDTLAEGSWTGFTPISETSDSGDPVETVTITLDAGLLTNTTLFVRVVADGG